MTPSTIYSHELRVLACDGCGAPLGAALEGGAVTCSYCGGVNRLRARDEREDLERAHASRSAAISESERMARLREQASREEPLPDSIAELLLGDRIARESARETLALWTATRARLRERGDFVSAERLFHLTRLLLPHTTHQARRALLETALESLPDHRHRHVLRCELAIGAARLGELEAAAQWLEAVEPRPIDLLMDSAARAARATIAAASRNAEHILAELGEHRGDVPVACWYQEAHELLRIHGLEVALRYDEALSGADELARRSSEAGLVDALDEHRPLELLPRTKVARRREDQRSLCAALRRGQAAAQSTPARAAKVAAVGAVLLLAVVLLALLGHGWELIGVHALEDAALRVRYGDLSRGIDLALPSCVCSVVFLSILGVTVHQLPRALRARRRSRALAAELAEAEARLAELDGRLARASLRARSAAG